MIVPKLEKSPKVTEYNSYSNIQCSLKLGKVFYVMENETGQLMKNPWSEMRSIQKVGNLWEYWIILVCGKRGNLKDFSRTDS